jgi:hypothetical protein
MNPNTVDEWNNDHPVGTACMVTLVRGLEKPSRIKGRARLVPGPTGPMMIVPVDGLGEWPVRSIRMVQGPPEEVVTAMPKPQPMRRSNRKRG